MGRLNQSWVLLLLEVRFVFLVCANRNTTTGVLYPGESELIVLFSSCLAVCVVKNRQISAVAAKPLCKES